MKQLLSILTQFMVSLVGVSSDNTAAAEQLVAQRNAMNLSNAVYSTYTGKEGYEEIAIEPIVKYEVKLNNASNVAEEITIEQVVKYEVKLNSMEAAAEVAEEIMVEPFIKYDVQLVNDTEAIEEITIEPVVKYTVELNNETAVAEEIMVEPIVKYDVRLNNRVEAVEEILVEPIVKYEVRLLGMVDHKEETVEESTLYIPKVVRVFESKVAAYYAHLQMLAEFEAAQSKTGSETKTIEKSATSESKETTSTLENFDAVWSESYSAFVSDTTKNPLAAPVADTTDQDVVTFATSEMQAVQVVAKKKPIERKIDKTVVNVDAMLTTSGGTAMDVLENTPGLQVDSDGNISMQGKQGVLVMIDGRPTYMNAEALAAYLKGLPASQLDKLEIMTNPPAKYDAAGNAGVINIVTKKQKGSGFNGTLTSSAGYIQHFVHQHNLLLNYSKNKWKFHANASTGFRKRYDELDLNRFFFDEVGNLTSSYDQKGKNYRYNESYQFRVGADYQISKKSSIGTSITAFNSPYYRLGKSSSLIYDPNNVLDSSVGSITRDRFEWGNKGLNLYYKYQPGKNGQELSMDLDLMQYRNTRKMNISNYTYDKDGDLKAADFMTGSLPADIDIYAFKTDYIHPISKQLKIEGGVKYSYVTTENRASYFDVVDEEKVPNHSLTNSFDYKEHIGAAYINFSGEKGKWGYQVGLRGEFTDYSGYQYGSALQSDSCFSNHYFELFPTAYLTYKLNDKHSLTLSYGRRIERPYYSNLNPFRFYVDKYTYAAGNPFLKPQFTNQIELGYNWGSQFNTKLTASRTNQLITDMFFNDGVTTIMRNSNFGRNDVLTWSTSYTRKFNKFLTTTFYNELSYNYYKGMVANEVASQEGVMNLIFVNNQMTFDKNWSAELTGYYRTKGWEGQIDVDDLWMVNAAVQRKVLNNKGTLKLALTNLFQSQDITGKIKMGNAYADFRNYQLSRGAMLSFVYRFGKPIKGMNGQKNNASDVQGRIKLD